MIKTTLKNVMEASIGLDSLLKAKLPVKAKYAVSKLAEACQTELERYQKTRDKMFEDAGCTKNDKEWLHDDPAVIKATAAAAIELISAEVEVGALPLDLEQFGDGEIEGPAFFGLDWAMKK